MQLKTGSTLYTKTAKHHSNKTNKMSIPVKACSRLNWRPVYSEFRKNSLGSKFKYPILISK